MNKLVGKSYNQTGLDLWSNLMMNVDYQAIRADDSLRTALGILKEKKMDTLPVVDKDGIVVGVLPRGKLYQALLDDKPLDSSCADFIVTSPCVLKSTFNYDEISFISRVNESNYGTVPVVEESGKLVGMMGRLEYLRTSLHLATVKSCLLESIFQAMHEGIITVNKERIILRINNSAEGMFGVQATEVVGKHLHEIFPNYICSNKRRLGMRNTLRSVPVIVNQVPMVENDVLIGINLVFLDISEMDSIAEELEMVKDLQSTLSGVLRASSDGVIVSDKSGQVKYVNEMAGQLFGSAPGDMAGQPIMNYLGASIPSQVADNGRTEVEVCTIKGRKCIVSHVPILDKEKGKDGGKPVGIVSTVYLDDNKLTEEISKKWFAAQQAVHYYRHELEKQGWASNDKFNNIVSKNVQFIKLKNEAFKVARSSSTVLLTGESGVGKDMFARAIHSASSRARRPFVKVNCAAIPETLFESELFGYAPGSFTGASKKGKAGYFEQAHEGTIFLDEIGDMPLSVQVKILQVLQDKEFMRVGGTKTQTVDVRVIAATNRDLRQAMFQGNFREDLFYRLNVISFQLLPLRERGEDILLLAKAFIVKYNSILGTKVTGMSREVQETLKRHSWPGNIRELENAIERAANFVWEGEIDIEHLPIEITQNELKDVAKLTSYQAILNDVNKGMIMEALRKSNGNKSAAARMLNISRTAFYEKLAKYVLDDVQT